MKRTNILVLSLAVSLLSAAAHADSCATGLFSQLLGTSCTIGDKTFTFSNNYSTSDPSILSTLSFTPESTASSAGFNISGLPSASANQAPYFTDYFTAVPASGTITSFTATLNGVSLNPGSAFPVQALAILFNGSDNSQALDSYVAGLYSPTTETTTAGGPEASFGAASGGYFYLRNSVFVAGTASFSSADFIFNESTSTVPEGSEPAMALGVGIVILGAMRKRFSQSGASAKRLNPAPNI